MASQTDKPLDIRSIGLNKDDLDSLKDEFTGQPPLINDEYSQNDSDEFSQPQDLMGQLKNLWLQLPDPLDDRIINILNLLSLEINDRRYDLTSKYKTLINLTGEEFNQILDDLILATNRGPEVIYYMIKMAIKAYMLGATKSAESAISDIVTLSTDLTQISKEFFVQSENYKESLKHISMSWNSVSTAMTNFMAQVDNKNLTMTNLNRAQKYVRPSPSIDSESSPDPMAGLLITLSEGHTYKSKYGTLIFNDQDNISFRAETKEGAILAIIVTVIKKPHVLERILNRNLDQVCSYLSKHEETTKNFSQLDKSERFNFIKNLILTTSDQTGQWIQMLINK